MQRPRTLFTLPVENTVEGELDEAETALTMEEVGHHQGFSYFPPGLDEHSVTLAKFWISLPPPAPTNRLRFHFKNRQEKDQRKFHSLWPSSAIVSTTSASTQLRLQVYLVNIIFPN